MSLTQHLRGSGPVPACLGRYDWAALAGQVTALAERPSSTMRHPDVRSYAEVGGIVGRRVEQQVEPAPPYAALMAAIRRGTVTARQAGEIAQMYPTHQHSPADRALVQRSSPRGWTEIGPALRGDRSDVATRSALVRACATDAAAPPLGKADETTLQALRVLSALDGEYRSGAVDSHTDDLLSGPVPDQVLDDARAVERGANRVSQQLASLCSAGSPTGHAAPTLVPHWADADVLAGPTTRGGYALLDVKTVSRSSLRNQQRVMQWVWQIVAYAALDIDDQWQIRGVGLVLPRQNAMTVWSLDELCASVGIPQQGWRQLQAALNEAYQADVGSFVHSDAERVRGGSAESTVR